MYLDVKDRRVGLMELEGSFKEINENSSVTCLFNSDYDFLITGGYYFSEHSEVFGTSMVIEATI